MVNHSGLRLDSFVNAVENIIHSLYDQVQTIVVSHKLGADPFLPPGIIQAHRIPLLVPILVDKIYAGFCMLPGKLLPGKLVDPFHSLT